MQSPDRLRALAEGYLGDLALTPELHGQADAVRYALEGGKRVRAVICLATVEAAGGDAEGGLPAAASLELVHAFSLVHDDLPSLDNDTERRGRPSVWAPVRRGCRGPRRRCLAGRSIPACALVSVPAGRARARPGDTRHDRRAVPRRDRVRARRRDASQAQDRSSLRGFSRDWRSGSPGSPSATRRRGARSETSSDCCSRSSTTSSTETGTCSCTERRGRAHAPMKLRAVPASVSQTSPPIRRSSRTSSPVSRRARREVKKRLDVLLVERGLAETRSQAQALVMAGRVPGYEKPGTQVDESAELEVGSPAAIRLPRRREACERARRIRGGSGRARLPRRRRLHRRLHRRPAAARGHACRLCRRWLRTTARTAPRRPTRVRSRAHECARAARASVRP